MDDSKRVENNISTAPTHKHEEQENGDEERFQILMLQHEAIYLTYSQENRHSYNLPTHTGKTISLDVDSCDTTGAVKLKLDGEGLPNVETINGQNITLNAGAESVVGSVQNG